MKKLAVILAGGKGSRIGKNIPKQLLLLNNKPILVHSVEKFLQFDENIKIVTVILQEFKQQIENIIKEFFPKQNILITTGGKTRTESVWNGLQFISKTWAPQNDTLVAIHDSARPLIEVDIIKAAFDLAEIKGNAVCCVPIKFALRKKINEKITKSVDRSLFYEVQTPQIFKWNIIYEAYKKLHNQSFFDSASLVEQAGYNIYIANGSHKNIKITYPEDLAIAECLIKHK